jgi:endonuclease III
MIRLPQLIEALAAHYGKPAPPEVTDPWTLIVWENVAYLVDDERRQQAMADLREKIGMSPEEILAAKPDRLIKSGVRGIVPEQSAQKLRRSAEIALEHFGGDLRPILKQPLEKAKKSLKRFPAIGDPGAEKILLFCQAYPILALDSNGLRVLIRLGFGVETQNYSATYRSVQAAIESETVNEFPWLIQAHLLLRRHGQEQCRRSRPSCPKCPVHKQCPWPAANPES